MTDNDAETNQAIKDIERLHGALLSNIDDTLKSILRLSIVVSSTIIALLILILWSQI